MFYLRVLSFFMIALYLDSTVVIQTVCIFTQNCVAYSYYFVSFPLVRQKCSSKNVSYPFSIPFLRALFRGVDIDRVSNHL